MVGDQNQHNSVSFCAKFPTSTAIIEVRVAPTKIPVREKQIPCLIGTGIGEKKLAARECYEGQSFSEERDFML
jgi:hypothetical protein